MKVKELKNKSEKELKSELSAKREALRAFRFGAAGSNVRNVKEGRLLRKDISRILTLLNQKDKVAK